jgi:hypothetical protein
LPHDGELVAGKPTEGGFAAVGSLLVVLTCAYDRASAMALVAECYHPGMTVNMHIRDLDEPTHRELVRRADAAGMSLRSYVIEVLHRHAALPTLEEWLDEVRAEPPLPGEGPDSLTLVAEGRQDSDVG